MTPLLSFLFGLCIGSFLNVCLFRWKSGGQVFFPPSSCPHCHVLIRWFDNIPVFSFLMLKGKCRYCHQAISWQYPLVEVATGILFLISSWTGNSSNFYELSSFIFVSFLIILVVADIRWKLLPHPFTNLFAVAGLILQLISKQLDFSFFFMIASGFVIVGALILTLTRIFPEVLGGGDIKMVLALSIWLGVAKSIDVLIFAFAVGALVALVLLAARKINRKSTMPFGPFLALGAYGIWFFPGLFDNVRMVL